MKQHGPLIELDGKIFDIREVALIGHPEQFLYQGIEKEFFEVFFLAVLNALLERVERGFNDFGSALNL